MDRHPEDIGLIEQLKDLIASQIPLLNIGIQIHSQRAPVSLAPLHQRIEDQFEEMKTRIEATYGKRVCQRFDDDDDDDDNNFMLHTNVEYFK